MQSKTSSKRLLSIIGVAGIAFSLIAIFFLTFYLPGSVYSYYYAKKDSYAAGLPVRLIIPKISVDAAIISVGVNKNGEMESPAGPKDVGWFKFGPRPGDNGTAIVAGHYGFWKTGEGSVFDDLNKLRKDDKIYVKNERGDIIAFVVRKIIRYGQNEDASDIFSSSDRKAHLNLITCEGVWNEISKTYSERLVIFTDKE
ncbi:MAG: class F sortase [Lutibacter sp.]|jgi:LPXTG-site transpeptidase (sortase) family protein